MLGLAARGASDRDIMNAVVKMFINIHILDPFMNIFINIQYTHITYIYKQYTSYSVEGRILQTEKTISNSKPSQSVGGLLLI